jgi:Tfp pilus assembly protein FimT
MSQTCGETSGAGALVRRAGVAGRGVRPGFTVIELVQVMLVTGIMMSFAATRIDWMSMQVNSATRQVSTTLLAAQRLAVLRQHAIVLALDTVGNRLRVHEDRNNNGVIDAGEKTTYLQLEEVVTFGRGSARAYEKLGSSAVTFARKQDGMPAITFNRSGSTSEMGGFYLTSKRAYGRNPHAKYARAFDVNRATGRVSLFFFDGTEWRQNF